jgi:serine phosphatase RsbU (regulator of sigma subunit)
MAKHHVKFILALFILFLFVPLFGREDSKLDSLKTELSKPQQDTTKAQILEAIGNQHSLNSNYLKAIEAYLNAKRIYIRLGDKTNEGEILNLIGAQYYYLKNWDKGIEYWKKAYKIAKELDNINDQARYMSNIGLIYDRRGDYEKALEYHTNSLMIKQKIGDSLGMSSNYNNIALIYTNIQKYDKAIVYYKKSLKIKRKFGETNRLSLVIQNLAWSYYKAENFTEALKYAQEGLEIATKDNDLYLIESAYRKLGDVNDALGNYKKANEYIILGNMLQDSIDQMNNAELIADMDAKYEAEKKDNEIALQTVKIEKQNAEAILQNQKNIWLAIGLFLALVLLFVAYKGYKQKQKANTQLEEKNTIIEEKNQDITDSITYASSIQQSILPDATAISKVIPDHFVFFKPKDIVSGDFYWFHEKEELAFIMAADCTGHGVPGAFVSMLCNNVLNQIIIENDENDPGKILTQANQKINTSLRKKESSFSSTDGMDCSLCVINKKTKELSFAGAYNQLIIINDSQLSNVKADRTPIGGRTAIDFEFKSHKIDANEGNCYYLFSDGYTDQFGGPEGKKFMVKKLKQLFTEIHQLSFSDQHSYLDKTLRAWKGDVEQVDDILVLGFKI